MIPVDEGEDPSVELSRAIGNIREELQALGARLIELGAESEAGFALVAERWLYWSHNRHRLRFPANSPRPAPAAAPVLTSQCKHAFGADGKCAKCGAQRKRRPRAPAVPPEGGAP